MIHLSFCRIFKVEREERKQGTSRECEEKESEVWRRNRMWRRMAGDVKKRRKKHHAMRRMRRRGRTKSA